VAFTPYPPLAGGVLTGKYERDKAPASDTRLALRPEAVGQLTEAVHDAIDQLRGRATNAHHVECGALALAWLTWHPDVAAPVVGPSRLGPHLSLLSQALGVELTTTESDEIKEWFITAATTAS
jgi:aryl-alcohol dehydrogenase-like predicted oxidoreductase